jgi:hypothetical protein
VSVCNYSQPLAFAFKSNGKAGVLLLSVDGLEYKILYRVSVSMAGGRVQGCKRWVKEWVKEWGQEVVS